MSVKGSTTTSTTTRQNEPVSPEKTAMRAYEKWVKRGCHHGSDQQDWLEAECELREEKRRGPVSPLSQTRK